MTISSKYINQMIPPQHVSFRQDNGTIKMPKAYQNFLNIAIIPDDPRSVANTPQSLCNTVAGVQSRNLVKQLCYIQTKMYRLQRKITIYGHFCTCFTKICPII